MEQVFQVTAEDIGKEFYPIDNSWSQDLTNGEYPHLSNGAALAGNNYNSSGMLVKILTEPLFMSITSDFGHRYVKEFVIVECESKKFLVLNYFSETQPTPQPLQTL